MKYYAVVYYLKQSTGIKSTITKFLKGQVEDREF